MKKVYQFVKLMRNRRVALGYKAIPIAALFYVLFPLDIVADLFPILGQLDDLVIVYGSYRIFLNLSTGQLERDSND